MAVKLVAKNYEAVKLYTTFVVRFTVVEMKLSMYLSVIAVIMVFLPHVKLYIYNRVHLEFADNFQVTERLKSLCTHSS